MIIKLSQLRTGNWLLVAEMLNDPPTWDRFIPSHSAGSERSRFDCAVKLAAGDKVKVKPFKDLLKRGSSAFEYDWNTDEDEILGHAVDVADGLGLELLFTAPTTPGTSRSAA